MADEQQSHPDVYSVPFLLDPLFQRASRATEKFTENTLAMEAQGTCSGRFRSKSDFASFLAACVWHTNDEPDVIYRPSA